MKTGKRRNKVSVVTMGCSKNQVDSEQLVAQLQASGVQAGHETGGKTADTVVIHTCGFIEEARKESIDTILGYCAAKDNGLVDKVYVSGCLSQRYKDSLQQEIPEVDAWFGSNDMARLLRQLHADYKHELLGERVLSNPAHFAYLKISEGCDRPCSFCAIPLMRGKHVSKPMEMLVKEATALARKGVKELIIIAQDSTCYGIDLYGKRRLADLLRKLSDIEGIVWIRLHYAFPSGFPLDVLAVMAERPNICRYLDIPLQHGATRILQSMRRGTTREKTERLLHTIRDKVPGIALRTTLMVGYPGEQDADFQEMMQFVEKTRFDRLGMFTYSHEENTTAYALTDDVPEQVKQQRMESIMQLQQQISLELNEAKIGKEIDIIVDRVEGGNVAVGRSEYDSPEVDNEVILYTTENLQAGDMIRGTVTEASEFDLVAKRADGYLLSSTPVPDDHNNA